MPQSSLKETCMDINQQDKDGNTALLLAVGTNLPKTVERLLEKGADANMTCKKGFTPLSRACMIIGQDLSFG